MPEAINVFIPAAGLGERLRPITFHLPKPLLPLAGKPVLETVLEKVSTIPARRIGINLHYKGDEIGNWVRHSAFRKSVVMFPEDPVLGTGGALRNAAEILSEGVFLVHNADVLSDIDLPALIEFHHSAGNIATLAVHDFARFNTVRIGSTGLLRGVSNGSVQPAGGERLVAFTGIAVYSPEFLEYLPEGISSVVDAWMTAIACGHRVGTLDVGACEWSDIGTPPAYAAAVTRRLRSEGESIYVHPSSDGCRTVQLDGYVAVEKGCCIGRGALLKNCIVLPGSTVEEHARIENCIVGPDFVLELTEGEVLGTAEDDKTFLIGTGGSDRRYYRAKKGNASSVLVRYAPDDPDFKRHLEYTEFFEHCGIPVPRLFRKDIEGREAEFEDLGDLHLYGWLKCPRAEEEVEIMYRKVIDIAVLIQATATARVDACPLLGERVFDYDHLRWETRYFMEQFVLRGGQARVNDAPALDGEFHRLAQKVDSFRKSVIHRDFQSQNVMITKGGTPRLIDYQGARIGPPAYDIASLLWDPYYRLGDGLRERLLSYYIGRAEEKGAASFRAAEFMESLLSCRLQRHMQALGAYGFLSAVKEKRFFLKHAVEGVRLLKDDAAAARDSYPELYALTRLL